MKQVPALVFVMDTTGSMFEEITAARYRAHSIIQSRASSAGQPGTFVLVPFHDPSEGVTISLSFKPSYNYNSRAILLVKRGN